MAFFGMCGVFLAYLAYTNDKRLILDGIPFSVEGAKIFYGVLAALSGGFVLLGFMGVLTALRNETFLRLGETEIEVPPMMLRKGRVLRYDEIRRMTVTETRHARFVTLHAEDGKVHISENMLPKNAYGEICAVIEMKIKEYLGRNAPESMADFRDSVL